MTVKEQEELARTIGINLSKIMRKKGYTNEMIYNQTNISRNTISYIKTGNKGYNVSVYTLYKIAKCLKVDMSVFFDGNITFIETDNKDKQQEIIELYNIKLKH